MKSYFFFSTEINVQSLNILTNAAIKVTYDRTLIEKNIFSAVVRVINTATRAEIRKVYVTWVINGRTVGSGFKVVVQNIVPVNGMIIIQVKVSTGAKLVITKTITIIRKTGKRLSI